MRRLWWFLPLLLSSFLFAQENGSGNLSQGGSKTSAGEITVQGCVSRSGGDYILMKTDPGMSYQLVATGKIKVSQYLGQQVEVIGKQSPSLKTSSNGPARTGPASVALTITAVKTIAKECSAQ